MCIQGLTFFFFTYTDEEPLLMDDQNGQREVLMEAVVEGERETEVAESEGLAEVDGLAEVEGFAEAGFAEAEGLAEVERLAEEGLAEVERLAEEGFAEVEGIVEAELEDNRNCLLEDIIDQLSSVASQLRFSHDSQTLFSLVSSGTIGLEHSHGLKIHNFSGSWSQYYPVLSFMMNGQLHAEYCKLSGMLGLPACSHTQWQRILENLEKHVTELAEWSCAQVREDVVRRGDGKHWSASFDGFYLTRGHYSNNYSATIHDFTTGKIAYFAHRTKRGKGHNWHGTSAGAETDMFDELLGRVRHDGLVLEEVVADKDTSVNSTFCRHFPEGTVTYCSNHSAKALHKHLENIKKNPCNAGM